MTSTRAYQQSLALVLPVTCLFGASAHAQSTWNGNTSTDWATAANWTPGVPAAGADIIIADATGSTNNMVLDASHGIGSFTFGTTGTRTAAFTLQTNAFVLTLANGIVANGNFAAVGPNLRGNFIVSGDQTWDVAGASGIFSDDRGVAFRGVNDTAATTPSGTLVLNGNVTKIDTGAVMLIGLDVSGNGNITVDAGALKLNAGSSQPLNIGGGGNITVNGTSSLFLARNSGTFNVTRPIIMNGTSTMSLGNGSNSTIASNMAWNDTAHTLSLATSFTFSGAWTGLATVNKTGAGELTLSGTNTGFSGTLNINGGRVNFTSPFPGTVNLAAGNQIGGESTLSGALSLNGGTINIDPQTPGALTSTGSLTLTGTNTVNLLTTPAVGADITVLTTTNLLSGGIANFAATGFRSAVFTQPVAGEFHMTTGNANRTWNGGLLWDVAVSTNWLEGDNRFYQADAVTFGNTGAGSIAITGVLTPSAITFNNNSGSDYTFTAAANNLIAGTTGLTKSGTGTVTLGGINTFTGNVQINAGTLKAGSNQAFGANGKTITIASGGAIDTGGAMTANRDYNLVVTGVGSGTGAVVNTGAGQNFGFRSLTLAADTTIGGTGRWDVRPITAGQASLDLANHTLTKIGSNYVGIVDATVTNPGVINVNEGTLTFTRTPVSGTGGVNVNNGAILQLETFTVGTFTKPIALNASTLRNQSADVTLDGLVSLTGASKIATATGNTLTIPNPITGTGSLEKLEAGTLALTANNTFADSLTLTAGTLTLTGTNSYSGTTTITAGTLNLGNGGTTGSINNNTVNLASTSSALRFNRSNDITFSNVISGTGVAGNNANPAALTKEGPNTLTLTAANTYTGTTRVGTGTIAIGSNASVFGDPTGLIDLRGGGIRSSDATPRTIPNPISYSANTTLGSAGTGNLTFTGTVAAGGGNKGFNIDNAETEFSGVISGNGAGTALTKTGAGKLVFSNDNTYTQNTVVTQGILQIGTGGTTGSLGTGPVTNNASLVFNRSLPVDITEIQVSNLISGTGSLTHSGPAFTILSADNTYTGATIITNGTLSLNTPFFADTSSIQVSGTGKLDLFHALTDTVDTFFINGAAQATGLWGRIGSQVLYSNPAIHETAFLTGDGLLSVTSSGTPYSLWAADKGLTAGNNGPTDNPDNDGLNNLGEFAFDGNPLSGANTGKIVVKVANVGGEQALTLTLPVRTSVDAFSGATALTANSPADGVTYTIEGSDTLNSWLLDIDEVIGADATAIQSGLPALSGSGWSYRTFRSPGPITGDPGEFLRARAE